ncbi:hypothetical protein [Mesonia sp. K7]|uniref:hypothetical protein n=1 Tax=Mesonia sp. K7 TaxID=2218606 RepID=UPI000DAA9DD5|nr:hypothetical protein [Mesonia sp. K7]PZD78789.1 hypothetical protein DNG35_04880 [Mesonia sp. K7]
MQMQIPYKKKTIRFNLIMGIVWPIFGIVGLFLHDIKFIDYGFIFLGFLYLLLAYMMHRNKYVTIEDDVLKLKTIPVLNKEVDLKKVTRIKYFAGEYTVFTPEKKLTINTQLIEENQKEILEEFFAQLNVDRV